MSPSTAFKKKLASFRPNSEPIFVQTQRTRKKVRIEPCDCASIERDVRQLLADKISGTMVGIWLLCAEHLRLGTYDLLCGWSGATPECVEPRLALQAVHEAALCLTGVRQGRSLSQKGFEVANGLAFVATDQAMHDLFEKHTVAQAQELQVALGRLRRASGHFDATLLAVDPHHMRSYTKRQMRRHRHKENQEPIKTLQCFFCLDTKTHQPVAFTLGSAAQTVSKAVPQLLDMAQAVLQPQPHAAMILADAEHLSADIFKHVIDQTRFDLLCPMPATVPRQTRARAIKPDLFVARWAGLATARIPYCFQGHKNIGPLYQIVQRCGEVPSGHYYKSFLSTSQRDDIDQICYDFPQRWHVEEFFNANQAMGWNRAGTLNLNIRYGQLTMALIAQALVDQLRKRLGSPYKEWEASHLAKHLFQGLDGDVRVIDDTIRVTYYNAPNPDQLRQHYENLPEKLQAENIDPRLPWLYGFKLDFRFN